MIPAQRVPRFLPGSPPKTAESHSLHYPFCGGYEHGDDDYAHCLFDEDLMNGQGEQIEVLEWYTDADAGGGWRRETTDLSRFAARTVYLGFFVETDALLTTNFYIDRAALEGEEESSWERTTAPTPSLRALATALGCLSRL
jgi:hypothetical protein